MSGHNIAGKKVAFLLTDGVEQVEPTSPRTPSRMPAENLPSWPPEAERFRVTREPRRARPFTSTARTQGGPAVVRRCAIPLSCLRATRSGSS